MDTNFIQLVDTNGNPIPYTITYSDIPITNIPAAYIYFDRNGNYRYRYTYPTDDSSGTLATDPAAIARNGRECVGLGADETKE